MYFRITALFLACLFLVPAAKAISGSMTCCAALEQPASSGHSGHADTTEKSCHEKTPEEKETEHQNCNDCDCFHSVSAFIYSMQATAAFQKVCKAFVKPETHQHAAFLAGLLRPPKQLS